MISLSSLSVSLQSDAMSTMNFLNEIAMAYPNAISFAPGRPQEKHFCVEKTSYYIDRYVQHCRESKGETIEHSSLGQYGSAKGIIGDVICKLIKNDENITVDISDVVVTVGCQEAMCLCLLTIAGNPGDVVLVENPAYVGISGAAKAFGIEVVAVPIDDQGIVTCQLATIYENLKKINKVPKALYLSPNYSNPTGVSCSDARRLELLDLTRELNLIVLEDHSYNYFYYNEVKRPCLKSMNNSDHVIYLNSFSKSIYPGIRMGFLIADQKVDRGSQGISKLSDEISKIKSFLTVNSSPINQAIVGGLIVSENYSLIAYTENIRSQLKDNRESILAALELNFPGDESWCEKIDWNIPEGGFFITLSLPFEVGDEALYECAKRHNVIWTPMKYFDLNSPVSHSIRLSFSYVNRSEIYEGIARLAIFVRGRISL